MSCTVGSATRVFVGIWEPLRVITNPIPATKVRCFTGDGFAVISDWDESRSGFRRQSFVTKSGTSLGASEGALATMWKEESFVRSQAVVARVVAGETLIVPVRAKVGDLASIYSFNGTGTLIWKLLESPRTVAQLATAVARGVRSRSGAGRARCDGFCE